MSLALRPEILPQGHPARRGVVGTGDALLSARAPSGGAGQIRCSEAQVPHGRGLNAGSGLQHDLPLAARCLPRPRNGDRARQVPRDVEERNRCEHEAAGGRDGQEVGFERHGRFHRTLPRARQHLQQGADVRHRRGHAQGFRGQGQGMPLGEDVSATPRPRTSATSSPATGITRRPRGSIPRCV